MESTDEDEFVRLGAPVLAALDEAARRALFGYLVPRTVPAGGAICGFEGPSRPPGIFFVVSGEVRLTFRPQGGRLLGQEVLGPGHLFGSFAGIASGPGSDGAEPPAVDFAATATAHTHLALLPDTSVAAVLTRLPALRPALEIAAELFRHGHRLVPALRRIRMLARTSAHHLLELLSEARVVRLEAEAELLRQGDPPRGLYYVSEGELALLRDGVLVHVAAAGEVLGDAALLADAGPDRGREPVTVVARGGAARLIEVPVAGLRRALSRSVVLQRSIAHAAPQEARLARDGAAQVALLLPTVRTPALPMAQLAELLAQAIATDHGDRVLLVRLVASDDKTGPAATPILRDGGVDRTTATVPAGPAARDALARFLADWQPSHDLILLDAGHAPPALTGALGDLVDRLIAVTDDTFGPLPEGAPTVPRVTFTALLGRMRFRPTGPAYRAGTARLRIDLDRLARTPPATVRLDALTPDEQDAVRRWGRAVTDRRVGVALGGGGAWGYGHVPLLRALGRRGVPVDVISGASFGSVIGAYYAARGDEGLELAMQRLLPTQMAISAGMLWLGTIERLVDHDLGGVRLEDLPIPFLPASTDLSTGQQQVVGRGTLGFGVRASGSFPGMFAPTRVAGARLVDGAISSNVPDDMLASEGATLIIASNIVAEPPPARSERLLFPGAIGRALADLNPMGRAADLFRGTLIMLHTVSALDAGIADEIFEPPAVPWLFTDQWKGREIAEHAAPAAEAAADRIAERYRQRAAFAADEEPVAT